MNKSSAFFDIEYFQIQAYSSLPAYLRMLADSIESGEIDARVLRCVPHGMAPLRDPRAHMLLELDLATEIRKMVQISEGLSAGDRKELE